MTIVFMRVTKFRNRYSRKHLALKDLSIFFILWTKQFLCHSNFFTETLASHIGLLIIWFSKDSQSYLFFVFLIFFVTFLLKIPLFEKNNVPPNHIALFYSESSLLLLLFFPFMFSVFRFSSAIIISSLLHKDGMVLLVAIVRERGVCLYIPNRVHKKIILVIRGFWLMLF